MKIKKCTRRQENIVFISVLIILLALIVLDLTDTRSPESPAMQALRKQRMEQSVRSCVDERFKTGLLLYRLDTGNYPTTAEGLNALLQTPKGTEEKWKGPYLKEDMTNLTDPWGNPYQYQYPGKYNINASRSYDLWSWGPDGAQSDDDIKNWKEPRS